MEDSMKRKSKLLLRFVPFGIAIVLFTALIFGIISSGIAANLPTPDEALDNLKKGNERFVTGKYTHPRIGLNRRLDTFKNGQHPFATVITCSDSRVAPEMLFDQGIGDLFVIRVAGNVCDVDEIGSIEYGVDHLETPLFIVLGHQSCGAVTAVVTNAEVHGSIPELVDNIIPAVETARGNNPHLSGNALVPEAVKTNVFQSIDDLFKGSSAVRERVNSGKLQVLGAVYNLEDGSVDWLGQHPQQGQLLTYSGGDSHGSSMYSEDNEVATVASTKRKHPGASAAGQIKVAHSSNFGMFMLVAALFLGIVGGLIFVKSRIVDANGNKRLALTVGTRILSGSAIILIILIGLSFFTINKMSSIGEEINTIAKTHIHAIEVVSDVETVQLEQSIMLERAFRFSEKRGRQAKEMYNEAVSKFRELAQEVDTKIEDGIAATLNEDAHSEAQAKEIRELVEHLETLAAGHQGFDDHAEKVFNFLAAGNTSQAHIFEQKVEHESDSLNHEIEQFLSSVEKKTDDAVQQTQADEASTLQMIIILSIVSVLIGMILSWINSNSVTKPVDKITRISKEFAKGNLSQDVDINSHDEIGQLADSFRNLADSLKDKTNAAEQIADGQLSVEINVASEADMLGIAMVNMRDNLKKSKEEVEAALEDARTKVEYLNSLTFPVHVVDKEMNVQYMNPIAAKVAGLSPETCIGKKCYDLLKNPHCQTANCATAKAMQQDKTVTAETVLEQSGIPLQYTGVPIKDSDGNIIGAIEQAFDITNIKNVVDEVNRTAVLLKDGKMSERAKVAGAEGDYKRLVDGFNSAIDNIMKPVNEAVACLAEMAKGDLTVSVNGDYKGDHAKMKDAMNSTLVALNDTLGQVAVAVDQVASGSGQVSSASQSLSQGATEQASSLEEITSSLTEQSSQTKQNADNASQANQLASSACQDATEGNKQMKQMLHAMDDINTASANISKIIKVIDEIAFQTNLLALNAAVEAARAGVHGKGFAVVAEEVRSLAQRCAKAAKETTDLIEGSVKKVENGTEIANKTAKALGEIVDGVTKVTDLVAEIASASNEQALGIEQINQSLTQIDQVTQANTASAEESASASEELSSQAAHLKHMVTKFKLKNTSFSSQQVEAPVPRVTVVDDMPEFESDDGWGTTEKEKTKKSDIIIDLDDDDLGGF